MAFNIFPSILRFVEPNSALPLPGGRRWQGLELLLMLLIDIFVFYSPRLFRFQTLVKWLHLKGGYRRYRVSSRWAHGWIFVCSCSPEGFHGSVLIETERTGRDETVPSCYFSLLEYVTCTPLVWDKIKTISLFFVWTLWCHVSIFMSLCVLHIKNPSRNLRVQRVLFLGGTFPANRWSCNQVCGVGCVCWLPSVEDSCGCLRGAPSILFQCIIFVQGSTCPSFCLPARRWIYCYLSKIWSYSIGRERCCQCCAMVVVSWRLLIVFFWLPSRSCVSPSQ